MNDARDLARRLDLVLLIFGQAGRNEIFSILTEGHRIDIFGMRPDVPS
jgi:hypothetical protein